MSKIKICGLKSTKDVEIVNKIIPNYIGFVLAPSKRRISLTEAKGLKQALHPEIEAVGVFVNETLPEILKYEKEQIIDRIQLHGDEDEKYIRALKAVSRLPVIKAFRLNPGMDLEESLGRQNYALLQSEVIDHVLLDTYQHMQYGGSGKCFDWRLLKHMPRPYFLAGGIGVENIREALSYKPYAIDISSKVETNGKKDEEKIKQLVQHIQSRG